MQLSLTERSYLADIEALQRRKQYSNQNLAKLELNESFYFPHGITNRKDMHVEGYH